jgi:hypothetical protein
VAIAPPARCALISTPRSKLVRLSALIARNMSSPATKSWVGAYKYPFIPGSIVTIPLSPGGSVSRFVTIAQLRAVGEFVRLPTWCPERASPKSEKGRRLSSPGGICRVARATRRRCRWAGSDGVRAWGQVVLWTASIRSRPAATKAPTGLANVLAVGAVTLVMSHLYSHNTSWG